MPKTLRELSEAITAAMDRYVDGVLPVAIKLRQELDTFAMEEDIEALSSVEALALEYHIKLSERNAQERIKKEAYGS